MRTPIRSYLLWVLLPVGLASMSAGLLSSGNMRELAQVSLVRMGGLATVLFRAEMGERTAEMAATAPLLGNPDSSTPILQAALRGDTVAALGLAGSDLVLSVALAVDEEEGGIDQPSPSPRVRAVTRPFQPRSLSRFQGRTGLQVALFLRGALVAAAPIDFRPSLLRGSPGEAPLPSAPPPDQSHNRVVLPLSPSGQGVAPVQLLVETSSAGAEETFSRQRLFLLLLPILLALGLGPLLMGFTRGDRGAPRRAVLFGLTALPLAGLWALLAVLSSQAEIRATEIQARDLMRSVALLGGIISRVDLNSVADGTGFDLLLHDGDTAVSTTLEGETLLKATLALPLPQADAPAQGTFDTGGERWAFAAAREGPSETLVFLARAPQSSLRGFKFFLFGVGGLASFICLGFPLFGGIAPAEGTQS